MNDKLKHKIENMLGRRVVSSADFEMLAKSVHEHTHVMLSATTLKRVFGYINEGVTPRRATLDVLAQYAGYRDYDDLSSASEDEQSSPIFSESLCCADLPVGQEVRLSWAPDRDCTVRHEGKGKFSVIEAKNTKLCVGDTFNCYLMIQHEPLYLDGYRHLEQPASAYVAGRVHGVTYQLI